MRFRSRGVQIITGSLGAPMEPRAVAVVLVSILVLVATLAAALAVGNAVYPVHSRRYNHWYGSARLAADPLVSPQSDWPLYIYEPNSPTPAGQQANIEVDCVPDTSGNVPGYTGPGGINFGDGSSSSFGDIGSQLVGFYIFYHTYAQPGAYTVSATGYCWDPSAMAASGSGTITIGGTTAFGVTIGASAVALGIIAAGLAWTGVGGAGVSATQASYSIPSLESGPNALSGYGPVDEAYLNPSTWVESDTWTSLPPLASPPGGGTAPPAWFPTLPPPGLQVSDFELWATPGGLGDPLNTLSKPSRFAVAGYLSLQGGQGPYTVHLNFGDGTQCTVRGGDFVSINHAFPHAGAWPVTATISCPGAPPVHASLVFVFS